MDPFIDEDGLIRVGGRIKLAPAKDPAHPIVVPKNGVLATGLAEHHHIQVKHLGRTSTVAELRSSGYWIVGVTALVKALIYRCVRCRLLRARLLSQKMADLPIERLLPEGPFLHCGLDMFGPFEIREGRKVHKRYVALFTCLASRAVHLEASKDMSTDSCINFLRRFACRRGTIRTIRSDNGSNFLGAMNELQCKFAKFDHEKIARELSDYHCDWITWETNPPHASHMGGVWERMIRSVRAIIDSQMKGLPRYLDDEMFCTFLCEAECVVNSRPISLENVNDLSSTLITPNDLLTMKGKSCSDPPGTFEPADLYCRKRWRAVQHLRQVFWTRWRKEYMLSLQVRNKWIRPSRNLQAGDVVLLKDDTFNRRCKWPLAKVVHSIPSKSDGLVRSVQLKMANSNGLLLRPVHKLVLLVEGAAAE